MVYLWLLNFFIFTSCLVSGLSPKIALQGTSHRFSLDIVKQPNSILWKHDGKKVVEFDSREVHVYGPYEGRITLDSQTAELEINNLRFDDSGDYELEIVIDMEHLHTSNYKLVVIAEVVKPTISCEMNENSSSDQSKITATLLCSAEPQKPESLMKFEWKSKGMFHSGQKLPITLGDEHDEVEYNCSVSNPLSSETASFTAKGCYTVESSSVALTVSLSIFIPLLLGVVFGTLFCKLRHKACFAKRILGPCVPENQSTTKGSDRKTGQTEERISLLERNDALPSHQRLVQDHDPVDVSLIENNDLDMDTGEAADEDQFPPKGTVKKRIQSFTRSIRCGLTGSQQSIKEMPLLKKVGHGERRLRTWRSLEEDQEMLIQKKAKHRGRSLSSMWRPLEEDQGSENSQDEYEDDVFAPSSPSRDSPSSQEPSHDLNNSQGWSRCRLAAQRKESLSKSLDTEEANT